MSRDSTEKNPNIRGFLANLFEYLVYLGAGVLVFDEFLKLMFDRSFLQSDHLRVATMVATVLIFATVTNGKLESLNTAIRKIKFLADRNLDVVSDNERPKFSELLQSCKEVSILSLSGTKTIPLGDDRVVDAILDRKRKARLTILLADPRSSSIQVRYQFDEPASYETGLTGIERRLIQLHKMLANADSSVLKKTDIRVFACYPTISIVWADDDIYSTSYGYHLRGSDCPQVHSRAEGEHGEFLIKHFKKVYEIAVPLADWIKTHAEAQNTYR